MLEVYVATVERVRGLWVMEGAKIALERKFQANRRKQAPDGDGRARFAKLVCLEKRRRGLRGGLSCFLATGLPNWRLSRVCRLNGGTGTEKTT
ncbi:MAG: hypothetical protein OXC66_06115 [Roseovarius sp.]|nr:hypothetical protein [Roseovarius sp.]